MSYQVLARRWRPLTFEAVVGQAPIVRTLRNALAQDRIAHAYLFAGPRGVGKTTTARLLAMGLNCEGARAGGAGPCAQCDACREVAAGRALDVIEIDGASNRGIDEVRALRDNARYAPARGRRKVYIIDEVHMLTEPAFNALLKTLEEPPAHVVFVLATTEARRLPPTILSRCQRFDFRPIAGAEIGDALRRILADEHVPPDAVEPDALRLLARTADGSLRDALSLLDTALAYGEGRVSVKTVEELLGSGGAEAAWTLAGALVRRAAPEALERVADAAAIETVLERLEQAEARLRGYGSPAEPAGPVQVDLLGGEPAPPRPIGLPRPAERGAAASPRPAPGREPGPAVRDTPGPARVPSPPAVRSVAEAWPGIVAEVTRVRPTLGHLLADGTVIAEEDGRVTVSVPNGTAFTQDHLKRGENRDLLLETARRLCPGLKEIVLTTGVPPAGLGVPAHPAVQAAVELFDAEVTQVRPGPGARGDGPAAPGDRGGEAP